MNLELCLNDLYYWCCLNGLALNPDKTDSILLGTRQRANSYTDIATVKVADTSAALKNKIKILGVTLDSHLTMDRPICFLSHPCRGTYTAFHHGRRSENHRLFVRYVSSRLRQLCAVWNFSEKHSSPAANAEHLGASRSRFFGI